MSSTPKSYSEYADELNWLVTKSKSFDDTSAVPGRGAAIPRFTSWIDKKTGWEQEYENARNQMIEDEQRCSSDFGASSIDPRGNERRGQGRMRRIPSWGSSSQMAILLALNDPAAVVWKRSFD